MLALMGHFLYVAFWGASGTTASVFLVTAISRKGTLALIDLNVCNWVESGKSVFE